MVLYSGECGGSFTYDSCQEWPVLQVALVRQKVVQHIVSYPCTASVHTTLQDELLPIQTTVVMGYPVNILRNSELLKV